MHFIAGGCPEIGSTILSNNGSCFLLQLYTDFYSSDIIISSPLGLRMIVGADGEEDRDYDFLASLEVLILDQADVFLMQNWDHLLHTLDHFHLQPKKTHGTDFSRVRSWAVNGWSKYYRYVCFCCFYCHRNGVPQRLWSTCDTAACVGTYTVVRTCVRVVRQWQKNIFIVTMYSFLNNNYFFSIRNRT